MVISSENELDELENYQGSQGMVRPSGASGFTQSRLLHVSHAPQWPDT